MLSIIADLSWIPTSQDTVNQVLRVGEPLMYGIRRFPSNSQALTTYKLLCSQDTGFIEHAHISTALIKMKQDLINNI